MRHNLIEVVMGAVVLLIAGFFLVFAYTSSQQGIENGFTLQAQFSRIDGLVEGNDVRISGVKVGDIGEIVLDPTSFMASVTMNLPEGIRLPTDTSAEITSESIMGGKYITLSPGADEDFLQDGDTVSYTQPSISIEGLIGKFLVKDED